MESHDKHSLFLRSSAVNLLTLRYLADVVALRRNRGFFFSEGGVGWDEKRKQHANAALGTHRSMFSGVRDNTVELVWASVPSYRVVALSLQRIYGVTCSVNSWRNQIGERRRQEGL